MFLIDRLIELSNSAGDMRQAVPRQTSGSQNHTVTIICFEDILERK